MSAKIFISYRRTQMDRVRPVIDALRDAGLEVFFDLEDIEALADFPQRIRDGLAASHAMLVWWSTDYAESEMCTQELRLGWQHARRHSSDVARRIWILNPESRGDHILAGELGSSNYLSPPTAGNEQDWARDLAQRAEVLLAEGPLADERQTPTVVTSLGVPSPSERFTGRGHDLWKIHSSLHPPQISGASGRPAVLLHGMGGVGKSELAAVYADQFAAAYPGGVFWLNLAGYAPEQPGLETAESAWLEALGRTLSGHEWLTCNPPMLRLIEPDGKAMPVPVVRAAIDRLLGQSPSLWIIDNAPSLGPDDLRTEILKAWSAPGAHGRTLATTRDGRPAAGFVSLELTALSPVLAVRLLKRYRTPAADEQSVAETLVAEVGAHTLALTLLGHRLQQPGSTYRDLLDQLRSKGRLPRIEQIAERLKETLGDKAQGILATFETSTATLSEPARNLLALASCCAPGEPIPAPLLAEAYANIEGTIRDDIDLSDEVAAGLKALSDVSLLSRKIDPDDSLRIHPLLADAVLPLLNVERMPFQSLLVAVLLVRIADADDLRRHSAISAYVPHARHLVLSKTSEEVTTLGTAEDLINLALQAGNYARARGSYLAASEMCERSLSMARRTLREEHPYTLTAMSNLAETLGARGDLGGARILQVQELALSRRVLGEEHPATLTSMNNLAETLRAQGDLAAARTLHEQALAARQRVSGDENPETLAVMNNLAETLRAQGHLTEARTMLDQALVAGRRVLGEEHPVTLTSLNNLATTCQSQGDLSGAAILLEQALATSRRILGEEHPDTLTAMNNLSETLRAQGDLEGAENMLKQVLAASRYVLGEEHPDTLNSMNNLAEACRQQGDLAEARTLHEQVLAARRRMLGEEHPSTLSSMSNLATTLQNQGDLEGARALLERVLETRQRVLGGEHPSTSLSAFNLFATLVQMGDQDAAFEILKQHLLWLLTRDSPALDANQRTIRQDIESLLSGLGFRMAPVDGKESLLHPGAR